MKNQVKKNFLFNVTYQLLILIIPLITSPYLSRVIKSEGVGIYSYTYSIIYYYMLITMLGVNNYGNRSIAKVRDNKKELSKTFWSIYLLQLIMGTLMILLYLGYVMLFNNQYRTISLIQTLFIISATLDINWFFFGLEEFKKTITRNIFVKIGNALFVFLFVKNSNDVWKYALIMSGMTCLSQVILWGFLKKYVKFEKISIDDIRKHIKPNLMLFIPVIAVSLYKMMDKIMLGVMSSIVDVGFYENAEKIISIPLTLITALGTVMLPRMSNLTSKGDIRLIEIYINKSEKFVMFLSLAMCFGLIAVGYRFAPFFFGDAFQKTGLLIMCLATTLPFISFANVIRTQYLIPSEQDKIYIKSVFLGAFINLVMNLIFIPKFDSIGACFGTIAAEISVMFYQSFAIRKELPIKKYIINSIPFLIKSIVMLLVIYPFNYIEMNVLVRIIIQVSLGCLVYGLLNMKYILSIINYKKIINRLFRKGQRS